MGVNIKGGNNSAGLANVSSTYELNVVTPQTEENAGFVQISTESDSGTVLVNRKVIPPESSDDYRLRVGMDSILFNYTFEGAVFSTAAFTQATSGITAAQASGFLTLNSGNSVAASQFYVVTTKRTFSILGTYPIYGDFWIREAGDTATQATSEWGFGFVSGVAAPTDGIFFRRVSGGQLKAIVNNAGVETEVSIDVTNILARSSGSYSPTDCNHYLIGIFNDVANFWINDILVASIPCADSLAALTSSASQPIFARMYTGAIASAARRVEIGFLNVSQGDLNSNRPWGHAMCGNGGGAYQTQTGVAAAQTANYANSAAPTNAVLSNTAASYATLGGQYQFLESDTSNDIDYALFAYQNTAASATTSGKTLYITGVRIGEMVVTGAASVAAVIFHWGIAVGSSAVSLATADTGDTASPKRLTIGSQSFLAASAIGTSSPGISLDFSSAPLVVPSGHFTHIIVKQQNGDSTATLMWRGSVTIIGYYE